LAGLLLRDDLIETLRRLVSGVIAEGGNLPGSRQRAADLGPTCVLHAVFAQDAIDGVWLAVPRQRQARRGHLKLRKDLMKLTRIVPGGATAIKREGHAFE